MQVPANSATNTLNWPLLPTKTVTASSASAISVINQGVQRAIRNDALAGSNDSFKILYQDKTGESRTYLFALLPAVDSGGGAGITGSSKVPEIKQGISIVSSMKQKNIVVPGGVPVAQTIGVESTLLHCVGAFIGSEIANAGSRRQGDISPIYYGYNGVQIGNSEAKAKEFMQRVVQSGRPVTFQIETSYKTKANSSGDQLRQQNALLKYRGLVIGFKYFAQKSNRTYYTLSLLITDYPR